MDHAHQIPRTVSRSTVWRSRAVNAVTTASAL